MTVLYFAWLRQKVGVGEEKLALPAGVKTVADLMAWLSARGDNYRNAFADARRVRAAVNQEHVGFDAPLFAEDEVAFFPPRDRRMKTHIRVQAEDFDVNDEFDALAADSSGIGALASFVGLVRGDGGLAAITLEHYPGMTEREIARHVTEAAKRWPLSAVTVIHRVGRLLPGARIVLVATASPHRAAAFGACEFLMDYLKTHAPLWKCEDRSGETRWVEARESDGEAVRRWREA